MDITRSVDETIQSEVRQPVKDQGFGIGVLGWMMQTNSFAPAWWSPGRDAFLRDFWRKVDHVAGAIYTVQSRLTTVPVKVIPKDRSIKAHVKQAEMLTEILLYGSEFGRGWVPYFEQQIEDLLCQDNGRFTEIIAPGNAAGPITGLPIGVAHLDASRCTRTGVPEYPVVYRDLDGTRYKLHYTRVMFDSQMPSPRREMNGVGMSALSRMLNIAQNILDILIYKQEKLGSRPQRQLMITRGGLDPDDLVRAFQIAEANMTNQNLTRYAKTVVVGEASLPEASVEQHDLSALPDGFDQKDEVNLAMAAIALALGVDARELFPAMGEGATRADALLSHMKQRGKGLGQTLIKTEAMFNHKFLPPHLKMEFDYQDDTQDRQVAEIRETRSLSRERNIGVRVMTIRVGREDMLTNGEITAAQFDAMELEDGRLPDGTNILALFASPDPDIQRMLTIPTVTDPLNVKANLENVESVLEGIANATAAIFEEQLSTNVILRDKAKQCEMAMLHLKKLYVEDVPSPIDPGGNEMERPEEDTDPRPENKLMDEQERAMSEEPKMTRNDLTPKELQSLQERIAQSFDKFDQLVEVSNA